jgi:hypothetical protein
MIGKTLNTNHWGGQSMRNAMLSLALLALAGQLLAADPLMGTWKLNLDKSKYGTLSLPKSLTRIFATPQEGEIQFTVDEVTATGTAIHIKWTGRYDAKDYPSTGAMSYDSAAVKRAFNGSLEWTFKKDGKFVAKGTSIVSRDGKTLTITWIAKNPQGADDLTLVHVYDKQ